MKHLHIAVFMTALLTLLTLAGCAGTNGSGDTNYFIGGRLIGYYDEDGSNSSWSGAFEVDIQPNGTFGPNGAAYESTYDPELEIFYDYEGDVKAGHISQNGSFTVEALIHKDMWTEEPLDDPYYVVANGQFVLRGGHYEGKAIVRYYDVDEDGKPVGNPRKVIEYDLYTFPVTRRPGEALELIRDKQKP